MIDQRFHHFPATQPEEAVPEPEGRATPFPMRFAAATALLLSLAACNPDLRGEAITRPFNTAPPEPFSEPRVASPVESGVATAAEADAAKSSIPFQQQEFVVAAEGETVRMIAERLKLDPGRLAEFNMVQVDDPLATGRIVLIPADAEPATPREPSGITEMAESAIAEVESASGQPGPAEFNPGTHIVREGETAGSIADLYGISEPELRRANNLPESVKVAVGEVLIIPNPPPEDEEPAATATAEVEEPAATATTEVEEPTPTATAKVADEGIPPPPSQGDPLPAAPASVELPPSPELEQYRTAESDSRFRMPVDGEIIRAYSGKGGNEGIDIAAPEGTVVVAAGDGEVALVSRNSDETAILLIRHPNDVFTVYANLKDVELKTGAPVSKGQPVGAVAGGDEEFLHFEVRIGTESTDPVPFMS